jgi:hypothetical protein
VHKPASVDLLTSQFKGELREIHPDFLSRLFFTGARVLHPKDMHRAHMHFRNSLSLRACTFCLNSARAPALCAPLSALGAAHLIKIFHCKLFGCGKGHLPS